MRGRGITWLFNKKEAYPEGIVQLSPELIKIPSLSNTHEGLYTCYQNISKYSQKSGEKWLKGFCKHTVLATLYIITQ